jgi:hypothetical protein
MLVWPLSSSACGLDTPEEPVAEPSARAPLLETVHDVCLPAVRRTLAQADPAVAADAADFLQLGPNRLSLTVANTPGRVEAVPTTLTAVECILEETRAPARVSGQLADPSSLTGRHISSWEDVRLTWSYEAKTGVHAIFRTTSD